MDAQQTTVFVQSVSNFVHKLFINNGRTLLNLGHRIKDKDQVWVRNSSGGDIIMRLFVCGWVSECVRLNLPTYVRPSCLSLLIQCWLQLFRNHFKTFVLYYESENSIDFVTGQRSGWSVMFGTTWRRYILIFSQWLSNFTHKSRYSIDMDRCNVIAPVMEIMWKVHLTPYTWTNVKILRCWHFNNNGPRQSC